jgi:hypothetical protein
VINWTFHKTHISLFWDQIKTFINSKQNFYNSQQSIRFAVTDGGVCSVFALSL